MSPLLPPNGRPPLGPPHAPPHLAGPPLPAGPLAHPGMAGPPPLGGGAPLPPGGPMPPPGGPLGGGPLGGGPQFPTTDPSQVGQLLGPLQMAQDADQQALQQQQMQAATLALIDAMRNAPNPAAQAAVSEPGYPTPPPAASDLGGIA